MNFCKKCGKFRNNFFIRSVFYSTAFAASNAFLILICQNIRCNVFFLRSEVKCKKLFFFTAFIAITAFLAKIHRISYKNSSENLNSDSLLKLEFISDVKTSVLNYTHSCVISLLTFCTVNFALKRMNNCCVIQNSRNISRNVIKQSD